MNRDVSKTVMTRKNLCNKFFKEKTQECRRNYNKQRNYYVTPLGKAMNEYYGNRWFNDNQMKTNPSKCYFFISSASQSELKIGNEIIKSSTCEKLPGTKFDSKLRLNVHVEISSQSHSIYGSSKKTYSLMNNFFRSLFRYYLLMCMSHSKTLNNKINRLHEGCLRNVYNNKR